MKNRFLLALALLFFTIPMMAQDFKVSVEWMPADLSARDPIKTEAVPPYRQCALFRISTKDITSDQRKGFKFELDCASYIVEKAVRNGEIWLWVSPNVRWLIIAHDQFRTVKYDFDENRIPVKSLNTYEIVLRGTQMSPPPPPPEKQVKQQYLVFELTPPNAFLEVDGITCEVDAEGKASAYVGFGIHTYRIGAPLYFTKEGTVEVNDPDNKKIVSVTLEPNFAQVTLKVDAEAEIWVNDEKKGIRTWTGILGSGVYKVECKQTSHETSMRSLKITPSMAGQTIQLDVPRPIYGSLKIESNPNLAKIYLDGKHIGETPLFINEVLIGSHKLRLEKKNCAPVEKDIDVKKGEISVVQEKLDTGRNVTVKTDRAGDKIYVDGKYMGETPREVSLGFGRHTINVKRGKNTLAKEVEITMDTKNDQEVFFEFGRLITITTDQKGDKVYVDGEEVGFSPVNIDLDFGKHMIYARRGRKYADKSIIVTHQGGQTEHHLVLHNETATDYLKNGVGFATLNAAVVPTDSDGILHPLYQPSFGATIGYVKKVGFFISGMSNFNLDAYNVVYTCNSDGLVNGEYPGYTGESSNFRFSVVGGLVISEIRDGSPGPLCFRFGAGYGMRTRCLVTTNGTLVKVADDCFSGVDLTAGIQFNIKGFTISFDAVTSEFQNFEMKIGLGYCWKHK